MKNILKTLNYVRTLIHLNNSRTKRISYTQAKKFNKAIVKIKFAIRRFHMLRWLSALSR